VRDDGDLGEMLNCIVEMANDLRHKVSEIPGIYTPGTFEIPPDKFDASTRLAFIQCGNSLDYAISKVSRKAKYARIDLLRWCLAEAKYHALEGDSE
jgi:hypothetical protein